MESVPGPLVVVAFGNGGSSGAPGWLAMIDDPLKHAGFDDGIEVNVVSSRRLTAVSKVTVKLETM